MYIAPVRRDRSQLKAGIVGGLTVAFAFAFGWALHTLLPGGLEMKTSYFLALSLVWLTLLIFLSVVVRDRVVGLTFLGGSLLALFMGARVPANAITLTGFLLAFLWMFSGFTRTKREAENAVKLRFASVALGACKAFVTALAFFGAFVFVADMQLNGASIPQEAIDGVLKSSEPVVSAVLPGFSLDQSTEDVLSDALRKQFGNQAPDTVIEATANEVLKQIESAFSVSIEGKKAIRDVIYMIVTEKMRTLSTGAKTAVLAGVGVLIFLVAKGIGLIFSYVVAGFAWLVYHGALATGFMRIESIESRREIIVL